MKRHSFQFVNYLEPYKLSGLQRSFLLPYFSIGSILNPERGDLVAGLGDITSESALRIIQMKMLENVVGRNILTKKPLINEENLKINNLRSLASGTFGKEYIKFMDAHHYSPDERSVTKYMIDEELAYVMTRYRQIHGELALKAFEYEVTQLPICQISTIFGPLRLSAADRYILHNKYFPWARRAGRNCSDLMSYEYELNFHKSISEIRSELNIESAENII